MDFDNGTLAASDISAFLSEANITTIQDLQAFSAATLSTTDASRGDFEVFEINSSSSSTNNNNKKVEEYPDGSIMKMLSFPVGTVIFSTSKCD